MNNLFWRIMIGLVALAALATLPGLFLQPVLGMNRNILILIAIALPLAMGSAFHFGGRPWFYVVGAGAAAGLAIYAAISGWGCYTPMLVICALIFAILLSQESRNAL